MKKLWVMMALGSALLLQTASLYAADIKFEGDFRVRGIYADDLDADEDAQDQQAFADGRFRLRTTATAGITTGVVTLDFTNSFNDPDNTSCPPGSGCATGNYRFGSANFGNSYGIVGVREAYLKLDLGKVMVAAGRKPVKLGHSLILDDTVDAVAAKFMAGPLDIVLANAKLVEDQASGGGSGTGSDTDLYVVKAGLKHGDDHALGVFLAYLNDRDHLLLDATLDSIAGVSTSADKSNLWILGVTADGKVGPINLAAEVDFLTGKAEKVVVPIISPSADDVDLKGMNVLISGGMNVGVADVSVALLYTTGDDADKEDELNVNGLSGNFVLGNILINDNINSDREGQCASVGGNRIGSGGAACVGGLGVTGIKLSAGLPGMPTSNCHTEVAAIWAQTTEDPINLVTDNAGDSDLGIEIDLNHKHKLDDNVAIAINLGYLISGDAWKTLGANPITGADGPADNQIKGVVSLNYMF